MNYFNTLNLREQLLQLGQCRFMDKNEFDGVNVLKGKKIVIIGAGAQGLHQGLNLRDSGLDVSYALRKEAISEKRASWKNTTDAGFKVGTYEELIPSADIVGNLTPDKRHSSVVAAVQPLMKKGSVLWYSHGFNIVEDPVHVHDLHATLLHQLGIDHERLTYRFQGRQFRLTDVSGKVVKAILS
jgi:ketol-acid reductoisomerase